ncbi:MAG: hypothetical protein JSW66_20840 [Phycisphaerales bacterium]|nr:MAG: hypothetical protein JSW66_20840 [Phycisphaerales bacterium]
MESRFSKILRFIGSNTLAAMVLLCGAVVLLLYGGVVAGLHREAFRMGLCFLLAVYMVDCCVGLLLNQRIDTCFTRLERLVLDKSDSIRLKNPSVVVSIFGVVFSPILFLLSILAGHRQYWLLMCVLLSAFAIHFFVCKGVMTALRINAYSRRLEGFISKDKEGRTSEQESGE